MKDRSAAFLAVVLLAISFSIPGFVLAEEIAPPVVGADAYPDGLVYTVVEGDTLWDLSAKYLGSPWKWPELWERNRVLTNPHYIYPGIQIVIFPPPGREIALQVPAGPASAAGGEAVKQEAKAVAPPAAKPATLDIAPSDFVRAGEFVRDLPKGIGRIMGGEEPKVAFSENDAVFLRLDKVIPAGQLLGVYRVRGPITAPGDRPVTGYAVYLVGLIQVTDKRNGVAAGVVRNSFEDLGREDILREEIPSYKPVVLSRGRGGKIDARVVSGQWENEELATGNFIFLDRGAAAGVAVGDVFRLYDEAEMSGEGVLGGTPNVPVGVADAVIVRVSPEFSTGFVTKSQQSLPAGGKAIGGGTGTK